MELLEFIQNFADQFDDTDNSLFMEETKFHELAEWSSLMALNIIAMVDETYNVKIKGCDIRSSVTIEDLFNIVKSRV